MLAPEEEPAISHQRTGQQSRLTENLEPVADPEDKNACRGGMTHSRHDRGKAGNGTTAQIISVGETAGKHHGIVAG